YLFKTEEELNLADCKNINDLWDVIESSILIAAHKNIPKKKITNTVANKQKLRPKLKLHRNLVILGKWISKGKKLKGLQIPKVDLNALRNLLYKINKKLDLNITLQSKYWSNKVLDDLKGW
ncbi:19120_t:CDS:1, partial [Gigaspora margarita]